MSSRAAFNHRLRHRMMLESQLLAEEKWIINNLKKIKKIRNCLQIERLQLESWKTKMLQKTNKTQKPSSIQPHPTTSKANATTSSTLEKMDLQPQGSRNSIQFEVPLVSQEMSCNTEELDLAVTSSIFSQPMNSNSIEEYEVEEEQDCDSFVIDMNMFMNGIPEFEKKQAGE